LIFTATAVVFSQRIGFGQLAFRVRTGGRRRPDGSGSAS
jgi:hypothetical protein